MYYLLLLTYISSAIPSVDLFITNKISSIPTYKFSKFFSIYIIFFNIMSNIYYYYLNLSLQKLIVRYFIELIVVNVLLKMLIDRPRPYECLKNDEKLLNINNFKSIFHLKFTNNIFKNQSFPSGHVATVYGTYLLFENKFYLLLVFITIYSRMNIKMHHYSDCLWSILVTDFCFYIFNFCKIIF